MIPAFVLHCKELPERTKACYDHLQERGVPAVFYRSFHGNSWGLDTRLTWEDGGRLPPGHVGLNLGAYALWQHILLSMPPVTLPTPCVGGRHIGQVPDDDRYLILEDDVELPVNFPAVLNDLVVQLMYDLPNWDLVFLGLAETEPHVWNKVTERIGGLRSNLCRLHDPFGTHAYIVRRRALPILLDNMAVAHKNLDQQLWERVLKPGLLTWAACLPSIVKQRTFDYTGTGKPEWAPSCVQGIGEKHLDSKAPTGPPPLPVIPSDQKVYKLDEQDAKRLMGASEKEVPVNDPPEVIALTSALINPFPCIYRGECLNVIGATRGGKTVPLWECARTRKACYALREVVVTNPADVVSCETCDLRTSMPSRQSRSKLPIPDGHFNPSIIEYRGKLILATRDSWGHSKVALWELTNSKPDWTGDWTAEAIGSFASDHKDAPRLEDPRLFVYRGRLCAQFNLPDGYPPRTVKVGYCRFAEDLSGIDFTEIFCSPNDNRYEKNWTPAIVGDDLFWVYAMKPHHIVMGAEETHVTENNLPWTGGAMRGGAAPVFVPYPAFVDGLISAQYPFGECFPILRSIKSDCFYHFFHGCLKRLEGNIYTMGCAVFEAKPPFRILRQTATPLLWPDLPGPGESVVKRFVVWPGGAVPHAGAWFIAVGVDDSFSRIVRIPFEDVEAALTDVPEKDNTVSIRKTPIALGTSAGGK